MEIVTVYSHYLNFNVVIDCIQHCFNNVKFNLKENGKQKSLSVSLSEFNQDDALSLDIRYRERETPSYKLEKLNCGLTKNLEGMVNYVQQIELPNELLRHRFLQKVMAANCEISFLVKPGFTPQIVALIKEIVFKLDAFVFAQPSLLFSKSKGSHFLDKNFQLILDLNGNTELETIEVNIASHYFDSSIEE